MSATIEVTDFNGGNIENVNDLSMSGNANIDGNAVVGHNLKVQGWLEAPNIKGINKGVFIATTTPPRTAYENLLVAYPTPQNGWIAGLLNSDDNTIEIWVAHNGVWTDGDATMPFTLDAPAISQLQSDLADTTATAEYAVDLAQAPMPFAGFMESGSTFYPNTYCPENMAVDEFYSTVYYTGSMFAIKYNDVYYGKWYNGDHEPAHGLYNDGNAPHPFKLYVKETEGILYYMKQEEGGASFQPLSFDTTIIEALSERISALETAKTPFVNAVELLGSSYPDIPTLSDVLSAIDALPDKAKYQVGGVVMAIKLWMQIGPLDYFGWQLLQWDGAGSWYQGWRQIDRPRIDIEENYLTYNANGELRLSDNARQAISTVLNNSYAYEVITE